MEYFEITGGVPLQGTVALSGSKNATTKLLVASLLSEHPCTFTNVPNIGDVEITVELCREVGSEIDWDRDNHTLRIQTKQIKNSYIPQRYSGSNRIPILMIGALLGRTGEDIIVPTIGGCYLGKRPVNFHIEALTKLGAQIELREMKKEGAYFAQAHKGLHGAEITFPFPSVGATENTLLAAVRARGVTTIHNAAIEPEIIDLILFLQKLGAKITFAGQRSLRIEGTNEFYSVEHDVIPDRNEAVSFALAALATKGHIFIQGAQHHNLIAFWNVIRKLGGHFIVSQDGIEVGMKKSMRNGILVETDVHPGFMTDWQQPLAILLTQLDGISVIHETVYENRFGYIDSLRQMGANIELFHECLGGTICRFSNQGHLHSLAVRGATPLRPGQLAIPDLRAGFAYIMAALVAQGESSITGLPYVERGYDSLASKLLGLGAKIRRVSGSVCTAIAENSTENLEENSSLISAI
jgi:UDP-N-acetylglucosamine 1-carboxyvinyltransferase